MSADVRAGVSVATGTPPRLQVLVLNGPNLNLLGTREPGHYGAATLAQVEQDCRTQGQALGFDVQCQQSNHEGVLLDAIHAAGQAHREGRLAGIVFNAGAYTHTSVALHDAIKGTGVPVIEVHISNVHAREAFRHHSYLSPVAAGLIVGLGTDGYLLALQALALRAARVSKV